ncbi:NDP-hexose 2,3-dehydratase family protein (plasmid) [Streptomyces sp. NBC_00536]|uniref:NDP-hexose 2,3-dehydratase family protein n=1 Tax=Streptomyces sp. NBC_00536 TaxID=2975769 RepID=UPI002E815752|nr:NDP-hexose 2,3-dehydratase family protein [Streptomyces sp. NBC_00536]WUC84228.1 NDP-hexose 2,3-dehydratase family protein [Streptomyces sp. NBC_00536]
MTITQAMPPGVVTSLGRRFTLSAQALDSSVTPNPVFREWFAEQRRTNRYDVRRIPFAELVGWHFEDSTGNLVHDSGRFFSVEGLRVRTEWGGHGASWSQPIINQPEVGILGIVVKEFNGILHCLMQAKMEPGNLDTVQLSPTVQATRSNYTGVHKGASVHYIDYFKPPRVGSRVLFDSLQSEQGSWFLRKRNRNMVVEALGDVPAHEDFIWLTLGQIHQLLYQNNVINMDARTVLSLIPTFADEGPSLHTTEHVLSRLTEIKATRELVQSSLPLHGVEGWERTDHEIRHAGGHHFSVIAASVSAANREVKRWTQPLLAPAEQGLAAFVVRRIGGVPHLLAQARSEAGVLDVAELGPTVQCQPGRALTLPVERQPRYLDMVLSAPKSRLLYDTVQSEEGGRFHHAGNRYALVEVGDEFPVDVPEDFLWVTAGQLAGLLRHSNYLNIEARTLLTSLRAAWALGGAYAL